MTGTILTDSAVCINLSVALRALTQRLAGDSLWPGAHVRYEGAMWKSLFCLLVFSLTACGNERAMALQSAASTTGDELQCEVALSFIDNLLAEKPDRDFVFSEGLEGMPSSNPRGHWVAEDTQRRVARPPMPLLYRARKEGGRSAIQSCSSVRDRLRFQKIAFDAEAVDRAAKSKAPNNFDYNYTIIGMSLPVVSATKDGAILYSSQTSGPMNAGGYLFYLKKDRAHRWRIIASLAVAVS